MMALVPTICGLFPGFTPQASHPSSLSSLAPKKISMDLFLRIVQPNSAFRVVNFWHFGLFLPFPLVIINSNCSLHWVLAWAVEVVVERRQRVANIGKMSSGLRQLEEYMFDSSPCVWSLPRLRTVRRIVGFITSGTLFYAMHNHWSLVQVIHIVCSILGFFSLFGRSPHPPLLLPSPYLHSAFGKKPIALLAPHSSLRRFIITIHPNPFVWLLKIWGKMRGKINK